ncbi:MULTISPECIES: acyl-CoA dehydrogenase family protein [Gordonia]|uniref:acyl-CoA dehydrogenase family protein n=1 Tax=Gordonia TaxID=2053 RepID=UPI0004B05213|nr:MULTISPECIES: acyl-CoA dehydrogenase family protein [Gordonia]MDH3008755.1 acyl-CoA dehydrogenase family protein [Gordonia alkanivorans]MDH3012630.1 acyl-CoA dehydrogenase family protein [Gordonia alkanivorans]MDH3017676.1 acyl-CoA dehydrogenase family protein [Gordonia alkanivorans]MDH3022026.1 acyl-CoA dehydrogenase family protein [Gordonia alkanivorans]MDH3025954.1 acyl-CoA dehydrogenase family protein [Gordonia alkanivorans]
MDLHFDPEDIEFRESARVWLRDNVPAERRPEDGQAMRDFDNAWQRTQFDGGWAGVSWPREYGGLGLSVVKQLIWYEEYARAKAPYTGTSFPAVFYGGPTLALRGTDEQRAEHLPRILRGEEIWSQGFSEPSGGSDLASVRTRAVVDGDELVVNGQKVWSSYADVADYHFCLFRTDPDAPKRQGLSWVLVPLDSPGIEIRRIKTLARNHHFCEVFYDDVRVPLANVVGGLGNGWTVAMNTLGFERGSAFLTEQLELSHAVDELIELCTRYDAPSGNRRAIDDETVAAELADLRASVAALRAMSYRSVSKSVRGGVPGPEGSIIRLYFAELRQQVASLAMKVLAADGLEFTPYWEDGWSGLWLWDFARTVGAGTSEIQRNIIGDRVLGLPR